MRAKPILLFVVNEAYFFVSHRLPIAIEAMSQGYDVHIAAPSDNVWAPVDYSVEALADQGLVFHEIPISRRGTNPLQELWTLLSLIWLFWRLRPDIVHLLTIKPNLYGGIAARLMQVPGVVYAITGLGQLFVAKHGLLRFLRPVILIIQRFAVGHKNSRVILQNMDDQNFLVRNSIADLDRSILIQGSGVDLTLFRPAPEPEGDPIVILPARLIWEKGIQEFVDAARLLRDRSVIGRFAIIGNTHASNPRAVPEETLLEWVEEGCIEWWGRREDMAAIMTESHIVCLPSKYAEGVPKVLLEAGAVSRAVVTTDTPGCRDIIQDGVTGLLVPAADSGALAAALQRLIEAADERRMMGMAGREMVVRNSDLRQVVKCNLEIYKALRSTSEAR